MTNHYMVKKDLFPRIKRENFCTMNGNFFGLKDNGKWGKLELYLPASPTTYGFESMEDLANLFLDRLDSGERKPKIAITSSGLRDTKDYSERVKGWFK